ncbi:HlyD family secretion protein [Pseudothauera rhizosphaerae]|uniref:HlyD family efflux transporter periplasmic adaptor subunit n=1 Tax=Pseudothauera rhizosphaerae TaxID=2565932 RepID=A0A4S4AIJ4_9RHOO|nr:HlyD family efflux transporter periplasmic adaptor subunit [Pseudothauera rhizosphaerae]THF58666.1 HlyD family efflux transporter periplasmic adaptor subunit [Pseudothauera rhizosphaerae]
MEIRNGRRWGAALIVVLAAAGGLWLYLRAPADDGSFARGNGRIEATEVDVASKFAGRVAEILVNEGDLVREGDVVARMDLRALEAQMAQGEAQLANARSARETALAQVAQRKADGAMAEAVLVQRRTELDVARKTAERSAALLADRAISAQQVDDDTARVRNAEANIRVAQAQIAAVEAGLRAAEAQVAQAQAGIDAAAAAVERLRTELEDGVLRAPRSGRVQYRIVQPGEVVGSGGKIVSLADIGDVYMNFFLPEWAAGRVGLGSEVRIVLDAAPGYVFPAQISYVASVAQFTPKTVETESERQKMVFRVKARVAPELLETYAEQVKTGLPGVAHVRLAADRAWPDTLQVRLP